MRRYELMLLLRPDLEEDKLQSAVEKVTRAIVNAGGALTKVSPWGKRRLAYEIGRHREASYFLLHFDIEPGEVRGIESGMRISEEILRHLVTVLEDRSGQPDDELPDAVEPGFAAVDADADEATDVGEAADAVPAVPDADDDTDFEDAVPDIDAVDEAVSGREPTASGTA